MHHNFIAIEGTIGAGKTSLATRIAEDYNGKLILEQFDDNPFLPKFYKESDKYAFPLELSFLAERYQQLSTQLSSQDLFKNFTISDYLFNKSLIFAQKTLSSDLFSLYAKLFSIINSSIPKPDLLVYLYLKVDKLKANIQIRGRSYEQSIAEDYLEAIQQGYFEFIKQQQNMRILILDTNNIDFVNNPEDYKKVIYYMDQDYQIGVHRRVL
ncbi:MAG: deoxynucleoside kinase [Bacteroidales bacterium]|jgi:deoxyguanosine kinase|nr:deoxynucleoside kinase [Bacteroidales bacterium]